MLEQTTAALGEAVLAHDSDPIAIIGFFGPALLLVVLVVALVVRDRRRHGTQRDVQRPEVPRRVTPPRAD